jgi:hypothetical protein
MIDGLKARVPGADVIKFMADSVAYHQKRAAFYAEQAKQMKDAGITADERSYDASSISDPKRNALQKSTTHGEAAQELEFLAKYIVPAETYELSTHDLHRLGKIKNRVFF